MTIRPIALALTIAAAGCGSGGGTSTVSGNVMFTPIALTHASYVPDKTSGQLALILSSEENPCDPLATGQQLTLTLSTPNDTTPQKPGTYSVMTGMAHLATTELVVASGQCPNPVQRPATDGTVTLDAVGVDVDHPAKGSLSLKFVDDSLTGTFSARLCGYDANNLPGLPCR